MNEYEYIHIHSVYEFLKYTVNRNVTHGANLLAVPRGELQHPLQLLPEARLVLEEVYREVDQLAAGDSLRQPRARNRETLTFGHLHNIRRRCLPALSH